MPPPDDMRLLSRLLALCCILALSGCAGYKLGPTGGQVAGEKSVQVAPFINETLEVGLGDPITEAVRKQVQRDGTFRLATHETGDIIVHGTVTHYERDELRLLESDLATPEDYRLRATVHVTARDRASGKLLLDQNVTGNTLIQVGTDLWSDERQARPLLASDIATKIVALLADGSW